MDTNCEIENKPKTFNALIRSWYFWKPALGIIIGGIAGFAYYYFVGCASGSCAITGNPFMSTLWGALMGLFLVKSPCKTCK